MQHKKSIRRVGLAGLVALLLTVAACGSSGSDDNSGTSAGAPANSAPTNSEPADSQPAGSDSAAPAESGAPESAPQSPTKPDANWEEALLAKAPVADADAIPAGTSLARAHQRGKLVNGGTHALAFFQLTNPLTGDLEGFDATMARLLAQYVTGSPNVQTVDASAATRESLLSNESVDVVFLSYSITKERMEKVNFAGPYFSDNTVIVVKPGNDSITSLDDLAGKDVCAVSGTTTYTTLQTVAPDAKPLTLPSIQECYLAVSQDRVAAAISSDTSAFAAVTDGKVQIAVSGFVPSGPWGIGLPKADTASVDFVNDWLQQLVDDGIWQEVWQNTIGQVEGAEMRVPEPGVIDLP